MKSTSKVRGSMSPLTDLPLTVMLIFRDMVSSKNVCFSVLIAALKTDATARGTVTPPLPQAKGDVASHGTSAPRMTANARRWIAGNQPRYAHYSLLGRFRSMRSRRRWGAKVGELKRGCDDELPQKHKSPGEAGASQS